MDTEVVKLKVGAFDCTPFRDLQFKYMAKDFFINAQPEELHQALKTYNVAPENIPAPFLAPLLSGAPRTAFFGATVQNNPSYLYQKRTPLYRIRTRQKMFPANQINYQRTTSWPDFHLLPSKQ